MSVMPSLAAAETLTIPISDYSKVKVDPNDAPKMAIKSAQSLSNRGFTFLNSSGSKVTPSEFVKDAFQSGGRELRTIVPATESPTGEALGVIYRMAPLSPGSSKSRISIAAYDTNFQTVKGRTSVTLDQDMNFKQNKVQIDQSLQDLDGQLAPHRTASHVVKSLANQLFPQAQAFGNGNNVYLFVGIMWVILGATDEKMQTFFILGIVFLILS